MTQGWELKWIPLHRALLFGLPGCTATELGEHLRLLANKINCKSMEGAGTASTLSFRIGRIYWENFLVLPQEVCGGFFEGFVYEKKWKCEYEKPRVTPAHLLLPLE